MSANSGITVSPELAAAFSDAVTSQSVRFLKISINKGVCHKPASARVLQAISCCRFLSLESLIVDESVPPSGTFEEDLDKLADYLQDDVPAYILVRQDNPPSDWLAIFYVPDIAKVRDKVCSI
jgi:twinfilin